MDFEFDVDVPEIVEEPYKQDTAFDQFETDAFEKVKSEQDVVNLIAEIIKIEPKNWMPFLLIHRDLVTRRQCQTFIYNEETFAKLKESYLEAEFIENFRGFDFPTLGRAATTAVSSVIYTDDEGKAKTALDGFGHVEGGYWEVDSVHNKRFVIPIDSRQAADLQMFCASVDINRVARVTHIEKRAVTFYQPALIQRNFVERVSIPVEVKRIFQGLVVNTTKANFTNKTLEKAPWIWNAIYQSVSSVPVPSDALPLPFLYFKFVKKSFPYNPKVCKLSEVLYGIYPCVMKELTHHLAKHSVMVGGVFLKSQHFENYGLSLAQVKHIGGEFSSKLCSFNTNSDVIWERAGAFIESPNSSLGTSVETVRTVSEFDGIYWNPVNLSPAELKKARGVVIPYDSNRNGSNWLKLWVHQNFQSDARCKIWCHFGPMPALWCEFLCDEDAAAEKYVTRYNHLVVETLWKIMGVMALYNFQASLNRYLVNSKAQGSEDKKQACFETFREKDVPIDPILSLVADGDNVCEYSVSVPVNGVKQVKNLIVPKFASLTLPDDFLPGRWNISAQKADEAESLDNDWKHFSDFAAAQASVDPRFKARPTGSDAKVKVSAFSVGKVDVPKAKKAKVDVATEMDE